jgi:hypothetical protein
MASLSNLLGIAPSFPPWEVRTKPGMVQLPHPCVGWAGSGLPRLQCAQLSMSSVKSATFCMPRALGWIGDAGLVGMVPSTHFTADCWHAS